jgi:hypothetical protein
MIQITTRPTILLCGELHECLCTRYTNVKGLFPKESLLVSIIDAQETNVQWRGCFALLLFLGHLILGICAHAYDEGRCENEVPY